MGRSRPTACEARARAFGAKCPLLAASERHVLSRASMRGARKSLARSALARSECRCASVTPNPSIERTSPAGFACFRRRSCRTLGPRHDPAACCTQALHPLRAFGRAPLAACASCWLDHVPCPLQRLRSLGACIRCHFAAGEVVLAQRRPNGDLGHSAHCIQLGRTCASSARAAAVMASSTHGDREAIYSLRSTDASCGRRLGRRWRSAMF